MAAPDPEAPRADGCGHLLGSVPPTVPPQETDVGCSEPPNASLTSEPNAKGGRTGSRTQKPSARHGDITVGQYPLGRRGAPGGAYSPLRFLQVCSASSTPRSSQSTSGAARMIVSRSSIVGARRRSRARSDLLRDYRLSTSRHVEPWEYTGVLFEGVVVHHFDRQQVGEAKGPASVLFGVEETDPLWLLGQYEDLLEREKGYGWPVHKYGSLDDLVGQLTGSGARCFGVHGTVGLHGLCSPARCNSVPANRGHERLWRTDRPSAPSALPPCVLVQQHAAELLERRAGWTACLKRRRARMAEAPNLQAPPRDETAHRSRTGPPQQLSQAGRRALRP